MEKEIENKVKNDSSGSGSSSVVSIIINGFFISFIVFTVLFLIVSELQSRETSYVRRDVDINFQNKLHLLEKGLITWAGFLDSDMSLNSRRNIENEGYSKENILDSFYKTFFVPGSVVQVIWVNEDGRGLDKTYLSKAQKENIKLTYEWENDLSLVIKDIRKKDIFDKIIPFHDIKWMRILEKSNERYFAFAIRHKEKGKNSKGHVIIAVIELGELLGREWQSESGKITDIDIIDKKTAQLFIKYNRGGRRNIKTISSKTEYIFETDNDVWELNFKYAPTDVMRTMAFIPWILAIILMFMTLLSAARVYRKQQEDLEIAEMSEMLEGQRFELKTSRSERDRLIKTLQKSANEHRAMLDSVSDIIFETNEKGILTFLNASWPQITGLDIETSLNRPLLEFIDIKDRQEEKNRFEEFLSGQRKGRRAEVRLEDAGGGYKRVEIMFSMIRLSEDQALRIIGTIRDVEQRYRAEKSIREAEQKYRSIVDNAIAGIYQTVIEGRFISANPALANILGYDDVADLMQSIQSVGEELYVNAKDRDFYLKTLNETGVLTENEVQMYKKDGSIIWALENARAVRSDKGGIAYYEGSIWDVTERHEANEAMNEARLQAELSSRTKMEFLANMSHELRTPLNSIIGFSEVIKDEIMGPIEEESYKEYALDIFNSGKQLLKIISEILEVSKIDIGKRELTDGNFKLSSAIEGSMIILENKISRGKINLDIRLNKDLPDLIGEELVFKQVLINLIGNSVQSTSENGIVTVMADIDDMGSMIITVKDTGCGMDKDELKIALQPFGQVNSDLDRDTSGTGLGLTIVQSMVGLHDGTFTLASQKGVGTTARICIPAKRVLDVEKYLENRESKSKA